MTTGREFVFSYMNSKNSFTFDGANVLIKMGPFRKRTFPFNSIVNYYVFDNNAYRSLFITYNDEQGKLKKVQMFSHLGEIGFRDLVDELNNNIGNKGLNHLPEKEAFKVMKAANPKKWGPIGAFGIIFVLVTCIFYPGLRHYMDFGFEDAEVQALIAGENDSRNLNLLGIPLYETLEETTTTTKSGSTTTSVKVYIPIVDPEWDYDRPIQVIMQFDELNDEEYDAIFESSEFVGVVRNIWYEGLDEDQKQFFRDEYDLEVADDAILFEVTGDEHNDDLIFWVWVGINGIFVIIFGIAMLKQK